MENKRSLRFEQTDDRCQTRVGDSEQKADIPWIRRYFIRRTAVECARRQVNADGHRRTRPRSSYDRRRHLLHRSHSRFHGAIGDAGLDRFVRQLRIWENEFVP